MFQTRFKYSKYVATVSTALYSQRVANSRKKNNTRQVSATVINCYCNISTEKIWTQNATEGTRFLDSFKPANKTLVIIACRVETCSFSILKLSILKHLSLLYK